MGPIPLPGPGRGGGEPKPGERECGIDLDGFTEFFAGRREPIGAEVALALQVGLQGLQRFSGPGPDASEPRTIFTDHSDRKLHGQLIHQPVELGGLALHYGARPWHIALVHPGGDAQATSCLGHVTYHAAASAEPFGDSPRPFRVESTLTFSVRRAQNGMGIDGAQISGTVERRGQQMDHALFRELGVLLASLVRKGKDGDTIPCRGAVGCESAKTAVHQPAGG